MRAWLGEGGSLTLKTYGPEPRGEKDPDPVIQSDLCASRKRTLVQLLFGSDWTSRFAAAQVQ